VRALAEDIEPIYAADILKRAAMTSEQRQAEDEQRKRGGVTFVDAKKDALVQWGASPKAIEAFKVEVAKLVTGVSGEAKASAAPTSAADDVFAAEGPPAGSYMELFQAMRRAKRSLADPEMATRMPENPRTHEALTVDTVSRDRVALVEWQVMNGEERQAAELKLRAFRAQGHALDRFYGTASHCDFTAAVRELQFLRDSLEKKNSQIDNTRRTTSERLVREIDDLRSGIKDGALPLPASDLALELLQEYRQKANGLAKAVKFAEFDREQKLVERGLKHIRELSEISTTITELRCEWEESGLGNLIESEHYLRLQEKLNTKVSAEQLPGLIESVQPDLEVLRRTVDGAWVEFNREKRQSLLDALDFIMVELNHLNDLLEEEVNRIPPELAETLRVKFEYFERKILGDALMQKQRLHEERIRAINRVPKNEGELRQIKSAVRREARDEARKTQKSLSGAKGVIEKGRDGLLRKFQAELGAFERQVNELREEWEASAIHHDEQIPRQMELLYESFFRLLRICQDAVSDISLIRFDLLPAILRQTLAALDNYAEMLLGEDSYKLQVGPEEKMRILSEVLEAELFDFYYTV